MKLYAIYYHNIFLGRLWLYQDEVSRWLADGFDLEEVNP